ncbi:MAG TPA: helix-turn-helix transcriptional regulator [Pseudonocardiaceae bacterium]
MVVGTTRGKRRLGRFVKPIRVRSGRKPDEIAALAVCSKQTVYRLESGDALPSLHRFTTVLEVIGATEDERRRALQLWEIADSDPAIIAHAGDLPVRYRRFRMDECEAIRERTLDTVIVPGMLQTADYAAEINRAARTRINRPASDALAAAERRDRQSLLFRANRPLVLHSLIDEGVLRRVIGGPSLLAAQLEHLLAMAEEPNITIQVVPFTFGAYGAMSGPITIFTFPEDGEPESAYLEYVTGGETLEDEADVSGLAAVWQEICAAAPAPEESARIIGAVLDSVRER